MTKLVTLPVQLLGSTGMENRSSIVVIEDRPGLHDHLTANGIITTRRNERIRISIHFHNVEGDIDAIADCIGEAG